MTAEEKLRLVFGYATGEQATKGFTPPAEAYPGSAGYVPGVPRLGVPPLWESDSGIGVSGVGPAAEKRERIALPSALAVAASWNPALAQRGGAMIGMEARLSGYNVLLGGSSVLAREPRSGRNFESAGEDPWLNGVMTGAEIRGIQSAGIISTLKHFALNAQETGREVVDAEIDMAQARVSDLLATQIALERSRPGAVMCAYNRVNGIYACENAALLNILKRDWKYRGFVMSDWGAVHSTVAAANAGLDQQSGWPFDKERYFGPALAEAVANGAAPRWRIDDMASRIVRSMLRAGIVDNPVRPDGDIRYARDAGVSQAVAEQGIVLLRNERHILPLTRGSTRLAIIGGHADKGVLSGGGSAQVHPRGGNAVPGLAPTSWPGPVVYDPSPPLEALRARFSSSGFARGDAIADAVALARRSDVAIIFATQWTTESRDASLTLPDGQDALIAAVAAANPNTIVVLETGGPVLMPWVDKVAAIVEAWYPGSAGGEAIARVLAGEVDATGRLPISFPRALDDLPRPSLDGATLPPGAAFTVHYHEGAAVGYKWFARTGRAPLFPFGHGLSFTNFVFSKLAARAAASGLVIEVVVRNAGRRAGAEIVQIYADPAPGTWEAPRRLIGFKKVWLTPGKQRKVALRVDPRLLATWDERRNGWRIAGGTYRISAGRSSIDMLRTIAVGMKGAFLPADYVGRDALRDR